MRVRPHLVSAAAVTTAFAMLILPAADALDNAPAFADPPSAVAAPGLLAYASTADNFHYLAKTLANGNEAFVLPADVSPPNSSDEGDTRGGAVTWIADKAGRPVMYSSPTGVVSTVIPAVAGVYNRTPALSPDGTRIAFAQQTFGGVSKIWVVNVNGTGLTQVTTGTAADYWPSWDPDGENLAYSRYTNASTGYDIYRTHIASHFTMRLTSTAARDSEPAWSLDGTRIAFTTYARYNGADGRPTTEVVTVPAGGGDVRREVYPNWPRASSQAAWTSTDSGTTAGLAFTSTDVDGTSTGIFARRADGTVSAVRDEPDLNESHPFWSPEQGVVGYTADRRQSTSRLNTIRTNGTNPLPYSDRWDDREDGAAYSADGKKMAFSRTAADGNSADIVIADLVAGTETLLPGARPGFREYFRDPAWSPDGKYLAYGHEYAKLDGGDFPPQVSAIAVQNLTTNARTEQPVELSNNGAFYSFDGEPSWNPLSARLVFTRTWVERAGADPGGMSVMSADLTTQAAFPDESDTDLYLASFPFAAGVKPTQLTNDLDAACSKGCEDRGPVWNPVDPNKIAFTRDFAGILTVDPTVPGTLTKLPVLDDSVYGVADPAWAPDGLKLAFVGAGAGTSPPSLWSLPAAGGTPTHLTSTPYNVSQPSFQNTADFLVVPTTDAGTIEYGASTTVRVTVTNLGPFAAAPTLKLTIANGLTPTSITADGGGTCVLATLTCTRGPLAAATPWNIAVGVTGAIAGDQAITTTVSSPVVDPDLTNNTATAFITVLPRPDLSLGGQISPNPSTVGGGPITVTFVVNNPSSGWARHVTLNAVFPGALPVTGSNPAACATVNPCQLADIAPGSFTIVTYTLSPAAAVNGTVTGTVAMSIADPTPANNTVTMPITVNPVIPFASRATAAPAPPRVIRLPWSRVLLVDRR